jgi:tRNA pseudouridine55 synthase
MDKEYLAQVRFGRSTDTLDPEGRETETGPVPQRTDVEEILREFTGELLQEPPQFSAVQVGGVRAYHAARKGERVALAPRTVAIHSLALIDWSPPQALFRLSCSKGTYVRALARDMGRRLGTCGMLSGLIRTRIGGFLLGEAVPPEAVGPSALLPASVFFDRCPGIHRLTVRDEWVAAVTRGAPVEAGFFAAPPAVDGSYGAFSPEGALLAVVERRNGALRYAAVLAGTDP